MLARAREIVVGLAMVMAGFVVVGLSDYIVWLAFVSEDVLSARIVPRWLLPPFWWYNNFTL